MANKAICASESGKAVLPCRCCSNEKSALNVAAVAAELTAHATAQWCHGQMQEEIVA